MDDRPDARQRAGAERSNLLGQKISGQKKSSSTFDDRPDTNVWHGNQQPPTQKPDQFRTSFMNTGKKSIVDHYLSFTNDDEEDDDVDDDYDANPYPTSSNVIDDNRAVSPFRDTKSPWGGNKTSFPPGSFMGAGGKPNAFMTGKKSIVDHYLSFGNADDDEDLSPEFSPEGQDDGSPNLNLSPTLVRQSSDAALNKEKKKEPSQLKSILNKRPWLDRTSFVKTDRKSLRASIFNEFINMNPKEFYHTQILLPALLFVAMLLGAIIGLLIRYNYPEGAQDKRFRVYLRFPGEIYLRLLSATVVPLIVSYVVSTVAAVPITILRKWGIRLLIFYVPTTVIALLLGLGLVILVGPGTHVTNQREVHIGVHAYHASHASPHQYTFMDAIRNFVPDNFIKACFITAKTPYEVDLSESTNASSDTHGMNTRHAQRSKAAKLHTANIIGLLTFSISFGLCLSAIGARGHKLKMVISGVEKVILKLMWIVIWYSPVGLAALVAEGSTHAPNPHLSIKMVSLFIATALLAMLIHGLIVLPLTYLILTRKNPFRVFLDVSQALLLGLVTSSSLTTEPVMIGCLELYTDLSAEMANFAQPIGSLMHMNISGMYNVMVTIFLSQIHHFHMNGFMMFYACFLSFAASIITPGVPSVGFVAFLIPMNAFGIPEEYLYLLLSVEWIIDRLRTSLNIYAHSLGVSYLNHVFAKRNKD